MASLPFLALLLNLGCGSSPSGLEAPQAEARKAGKARTKPERPEPQAAAAKPPRALKPTPREDGQPETIVLVVEDTVRADHMHLCGYERPTTPFLERFIQQRGATHTCFAYSPGTWTLPSHASYLTGLDPTEHHALHKGYPLQESAHTLGEHFSELGYQTVLVSANPTLASISGLWQGFDHAVAAKNLYTAFREQELADQVSQALDGLDPDKPLFLVVNIFDAHDPYPAVPEGIPWVRKQKKVDINPSQNGEDSDVHRYMRGELPKKESKQFLERIVDTYDYGISLADQNLGRVAEILREGGWLDRDHRVLITSDHGEHLGHHQLVRHDGPPWEGVSRVFMAYLDTTREPHPKLPSPISATATYWLLKDGTLPEGSKLPVTSVSVAYQQGSETRKDAVAVWGRRADKLFWIEGEEAMYQVMKDPGERSPGPVEGHPLAPLLQQRVIALAKSREIAFAGDEDGEMMKLLEDIGYVE